jgi:thiamine biosynthesis lipoprotein
MKQTQLIMGMPITVEIVDSHVGEEIFEKVFEYFTSVDEKFSTYKKTSEISRFNSNQLSKEKLSTDVKLILQLAKDTKRETNGYFTIEKDGIIDPSGIVKGWAIYNAAEMLKKNGFQNYYVDAGGDIQVSGRNKEGSKWRVGIRNPFQREEIIKVLALTEEGVATSGTSIRGQHIYNPFSPKKAIMDIVSLTVIAPNIYDADRFATAAFDMGKKGIHFIEQNENLEGYMIDASGKATFTSGFNLHVLKGKDIDAVC